MYISQTSSHPVQNSAITSGIHDEQMYNIDVLFERIISLSLTPKTAFHFQQNSGRPKMSFETKMLRSRPLGLFDF